MKKLLLDTHIFLWWIDNNLYRKIGSQRRSLISDPANEVYVSVASLWEISIKKSMGNLTAPSNIENLIEKKGFKCLAISPFHTEQISSMPFVTYPHKDKLHKNPFDRMLVTQAQSEGMFLISADSVFPNYKIRLINPSD